MGNEILAFFAGLFALLALGASVAIPYWILQSATGELAELRIPLLALSGFLAVFACVALLVLAFKAMGLTNNAQALGMPEGSVRALIAIFLIVTLGMSALFLLGPSRPGKEINPDLQENKSKGENTTPTGSEPNATETPQNTGGPTGTGVTAAPPLADGARFGHAVFRRTATPKPHGQDKTPPKDNNGADADKSQGQTATAAGANQGAGDLAKQFLTLVGTLVTTVVGFYFGSQTTNSAATKGANAAKEAATAAIHAMKMPNG